MMQRYFKAALLAFTFAASPCFASDYCGLLTQPTAVGATPPSRTAEQILKTLSEVAPFNPQTIYLRDARDSELRTQGAAAQVCNINQRWIFYDPDFVEQIRAKGQSDWPKYFIFAHEVAHLLNNDPLDHHRDQELQADRGAAHWLTSIGASVQDLVDSINAFVTNETREPDYPSRCDRITGVITAYDEEATIINSQGGDKPLYDVGNCMPLAVGGGLYAAKDVETGSTLQAVDVFKSGNPAPNANFPLEFNRDVAGFCAVKRLRQGDRLTWDNIGICH